jgi:hypothetical protein
MTRGWWDHSPDENERLARAFGYPYHIPEHSYLVVDQSWQPLTTQHAEGYRDNRTPVLAVGSNQSPEQILRKFQGPDWSPIACEKCTVANFDTVFSAHITSYGSIAAALHPSPGTTVSLFVNWLDDAQLEAMHPTELGHENYVYARLKDIELHIENGPTLSEVYFYRGNAGAYAPLGDPIPLAEVMAPGRQWAAMGQRDIQAHLTSSIANNLNVDEFVLSSISEVDERNRRRSHMERTSHHFNHPHDVLLGTDKLNP